MCKNLTDLMGAELLLDDNYDSGIPGCPGAKFVVNLNSSPVAPPLSLTRGLSNIDDSVNGVSSAKVTSLDGGTSAQEVVQKLPEELSILFVDDDAILRKLFSRSLRTIAQRLENQGSSKWRDCHQAYRHRGL